MEELPEKPSVPKSGVCFAVVPADAQLDFKALARLSGDRAVEMVALKEVQPLSGYVRGGVTVLGPSPAFIHRLRGEYRWSLTIKAADLEPLLPLLPDVAGFAIDIDPI